MNTQREMKMTNEVECVNVPLSSLHSSLCDNTDNSDDSKEKKTELSNMEKVPEAAHYELPRQINSSGTMEDLPILKEETNDEIDLNTIGTISTCVVSNNMIAAAIQNTSTNHNTSTINITGQSSLDKKLKPSSKEQTKTAEPDILFPETSIKSQFSRKMKDAKENVKRLQDSSSSNTHLHSQELPIGKSIRSIHESSIPATKIDLIHRPKHINTATNQFSLSSTQSINSNSSVIKEHIDEKSKHDDDICRNTRRSRAHLSHDSLDPIHQQKHIELLNAVDTTKLKQMKKTKYLNESTVKFEKTLEKCVKEKYDEKLKKKNHQTRRSKDDHAILQRSDGFFVETLNLSLLLHVKKLSRFQCLDVLLRAFSKDVSDVVISCTKVADDLHPVVNHNSKSYTVGYGTFGHVCKMTTVDSKVFARKRLLQGFSKNEALYLDVIGNCEDHECWKYAPRLLGVSREDGVVYIRQEFLESTWYSVRNITPIKLFKMLEDGLNALVCLKIHKIFHKDIKPTNLGCDREGCNTKLLDFGSSQSEIEATNNFTLLGMTWPYMPPEIFTRKKHHQNSDIYQLGLSILFPLLGYTPYEYEWHYWRYGSDQDRKQEEDITNLIRNRPDIVINRVRHASMSQDWKDLLLLILERNPDQRITPEEALAHKVFKEKIVPFEKMPEEISVKLNKIDVQGSAKILMMTKSIKRLTSTSIEAAQPFDC